jgi:hypothetical protein
MLEPGPPKTYTAPVPNCSEALFELTLGLESPATMVGPETATAGKPKFPPGSSFAVKNPTRAQVPELSL